MSIAERKNSHLDVNLHCAVGSTLTAGFEKYRLTHNALPEADFDTYSIASVFLGKRIDAPILISSMTGGTEHGERINRNLLTAAAELGLPFGIGSQRVYLEDSARKVFPVRSIAKETPVLANVGAVQLNYGYGRDQFLRAVDMIEADALILHINPLQELVQKGGDTNFAALLPKIAALCADFPVPVIAKEVGWGFSVTNAKALLDAGVSYIDVAGAGGTSWSQVESFIDGSPEASELARPFAGWGIPTAECLDAIHTALPGAKLIASGGLKDGVDAAKAVTLGAELAGFAGRILPAAAEETPDALIKTLRTIIQQYKIVRFLSSGIEKIA